MTTKIFRILFFLQLIAGAKAIGQDTIYFDLNQSTLNYEGGQQQLTIPVFFSGTNTTVNAVDFWFQYNTTKYTYIASNAVQAEADIFTHYNAEIDYLSSTISTSQTEVHLTDQTPFLTLQFEVNNPCDEILVTDFTDSAGLINGEAASTQWTLPSAVIANITIVTPQPWCVGSPIAFTFQDEINGQSIDTYNWSAGGSSGSSSDFEAIYATAGTFNAEVSITTEAGCNYLYVNEISIQSGPNVSFDWTGTDAAEPIQFNNTTTFLEGLVTSYSWDFGNGGTSVDENPTYTYPVAGNFTITLTADGDNGCSTSATQNISIVSDINEFKAIERLVYPNPAADRCIITNATTKNLMVYNSYGQKIEVDARSIAQGAVEISLRGLSTGLYFIQIDQNNYPLLVQ